MPTWQRLLPSFFKRSRGFLPRRGQVTVHGDKDSLFVLSSVDAPPVISTAGVSEPSTLSLRVPNIWLRWDAEFTSTALIDALTQTCSFFSSPGRYSVSLNQSRSNGIRLLSQMNPRCFCVRRCMYLFDTSSLRNFGPARVLRGLLVCSRLL